MTPAELNFLGLWILRNARYQNSEGKIFYPLGHQPQGHLAYFPNGRVMVQINGLETATASSIATPEEAPTAALHKEGVHYAYYGTFEVLKDTREVRHNITFCSDPNSSSTSVRRKVSLVEDHLSLQTEPFAFEGETIVGHLEWQRQA